MEAAYAYTPTLDTLVIAVYVKIDETLQSNPSLRSRRPAVRIAPKLSDAELLTLAVAQALLGHLFPYLPGQSGYNKRLRAAAPQLVAFIPALAVDTELWADPIWVADSTPGGVWPLPPRPGQGLFRPLQQRIESVNRRSRASLTWNATAAARSGASPRGCCNDCWPDRRDLAQPPRRPAGPALPARLRPLRPLINLLESIV